MSFTTTTTDDARIQNALTLRYVTTPPQELLFNEQADPLMRVIQDEANNKNPGAGFVVQWVGRNGIGPNPLWAEAGKNAEAYDKIVVPAVDFNWRASWTRNAMIDAKAEGSAGVYNLAKSKIDREIKYTQLGITNMLEGDGWGTLAYVNSLGTTTFKVADSAGNVVPQLTNRFRLNQRLHFAASPGSGNKRGSSPGSEAVVTAINRADGTITVDVDVTGFSVGNGDAISEVGFRPYAASSGKQTMLGLDFWIPWTAITDSSDPRYQKEHLQPLRFTPSGTPGSKEYLLQMVEFALTQRLDIGDNPMVLVSHKDHRILANLIESTRIVVQRLKDNGETYEIGVPSVTLQTGMGDIPVIATAGVTPGIVRFGDFKKHFRFYYSGPKLINVLNDDGRVYRVANELGITDNNGVQQSGFNAEGYSRLQMVCLQPGAFVTGTGYNS